MAYGLVRINAGQEVLAEFIPTLESELLFDNDPNRPVLRTALTDTTTEQYFFHKGDLSAQFNFVSTGPFGMPPSSRRSPYRERDDAMSMAVWIAATVGQSDVLNAYPTEPSPTNARRA